MIGQRLGPFEITAKLGEGGMGEVYRATDSRLKREVAIKVLPPAFTADPERLARFEREAQILAQLNHPNIAGIHGLEEASGVRALVMELVEGPTLAERLEAGRVPLDECVTIAVQLARALEAAHEKGVVHRDLKPQNIKIAPDGNVKVLDFGLAKALEPATAGSGAAERSPAVMNSPTLTAAGTQLGVILGTAAYMAPEQARGGTVDRRADIWAFGVVLYEMLSGRRLFTGDSVADTLASVLRADLDFAALPPETPAALRRILSRCLERDPKRRWRDAGDLAIEIADAPAGRENSNPAAPAAASRSAPSRWRGAAALLAALAVGAGAMWLARGSAAEPAALPVPKFDAKTFGRQRIFGARFMPDGRNIVYGSALAGNRPELFLLAPGSMAPQKIGPPGTALLSVSASGELAILTDTTYLGHRVLEGTLARMTVDGAPRALVDSVRDADWGPGGELAIVQRRSGVDRLEYPPGKVLYQTTGYVSEPRFSRDGTRIAFLDHPWWIDDRGWVKVVDLAGKVESLAGEYWATQGLAWSADGKRLFFAGANEETGNRLQPKSVALSGGVSRAELAVPGELMVVDVAADGRWLAINEDGFYGFAVRRPGGQPDLDLSWLDLSWSASLSPDGQTALFTNGHGGANYTTVTRRTDGSPISTLGEGESLGFSPDGAWVAAKIPTPPEIVLYPTGAGTPRRLERGTIESYETGQWFPDGRSLLLTANEPARPLRSFRQAIDGGPPQAVTPEGIYGTLSPRGDGVVAQGGDSTWKLYPLAGGEPRAVSGLGKLDAITAWSSGGDAVYVRRLGEVPMRLERVDISTGKRTPSLVVGPADQTGLVRVVMGDLVIDPNRPFAYCYLRRLSTLYMISGVKP